MQHTLKQAIEAFGTKEVVNTLTEACDAMMAELKKPTPDIIRTKVRLKICFDKIEESKSHLAICEQKHEWFHEWIIELCEGEMKRLKRRLPMANGYTAHIDIEAIKRDVTIESIMPTQPTEQYNSKRMKYCCPLHNEKTPSFTVYVDTNSWYCFGCARGGSVIDLYMALHDVTFGEALKKLRSSCG